jgi:hypothetical protein
VFKSTIKMPRSFAERSDYHPISNRLLCDRSLITQADADKVMKGDRLNSKL